MFIVTANYKTPSVTLAYKYAWILSSLRRVPIIIYLDDEIFDRVDASIDSLPTLVEIPLDTIKLDLDTNKRNRDVQPLIDSILGRDHDHTC